MKKNLRIVSAAAAALLAVAPVAATAVSTVNAAPVENITNTQISWGIPSLTDKATVNVKPNLQLQLSLLNKHLVVQLQLTLMVLITALCLTQLLVL